MKHSHGMKQKEASTFTITKGGRASCKNILETVTCSSSMYLLALVPRSASCHAEGQCAHVLWGQLRCGGDGDEPQRQ